MARILYLTQIDIDFGAVRLLPEECQRIGITKPLVVTDAGVRAAGVLQLALNGAGQTCRTRCSTPRPPTPPKPPCAPPWRSCTRPNGCDGLVAVGGGSSIDLAKGVAIAATHEGPLKTYATIEGGSPKISDRVLPLIAVPTTAGTGQRGGARRHPHRRRRPQAGLPQLAPDAQGRPARPRAHAGPAPRC